MSRPTPELHPVDGLTPSAVERYSLELQDLMRFFDYAHLPPRLQDVSMPFNELAQALMGMCFLGPQLLASLQKLLEAKDAAVRAAL